MIGQTRQGSLLESIVNVAVGYGIALVSQLIIFHFFGVHFSLRTNMAMGLWFTGVSVVRSYTLRRIFNGLRSKTLWEGQ